jgi:hypothetical protein
MSLSWNEIKTRAAAQTFETGFFHIFGVDIPIPEHVYE